MTGFHLETPPIQDRTLTETVGRMAYEGMTDVQIADRTGRSQSTVRTLLARVRLRDGLARRKDMGGYAFLVRLPRHAVEALAFAAAARKITPTALAEAVLERIVTDGLVGAVMDDSDP